MTGWIGSDTRRIPECAADGCTAIPRDPTTSIPAAVSVRRWWCPEHVDQAEPGDMEQVAQWRFAPGGGIERIPLQNGIIG